MDIEKLKFYREKKGFTQKEVAEKLNISTRAYQYYEQGDREPNTQTAIHISEILDIPLTEEFKKIFSN